MSSQAKLNERVQLAKSVLERIKTCSDPVTHDALVDYAKDLLTEVSLTLGAEKTVVVELD